MSVSAKLWALVNALYSRLYFGCSALEASWFASKCLREGETGRGGHGEAAGTSKGRRGTGLGRGGGLHAKAGPRGHREGGRAGKGGGRPPGSHAPRTKLRPQDVVSPLM